MKASSQIERAFMVQGAGASIASANDIPPKQLALGLHIYMGGIGLQQFVILIFTYLAIRFQQRTRQEEYNSALVGARKLLYVLYAVLTLITVSSSI